MTDETKSALCAHPTRWIASGNTLAELDTEEAETVKKTKIIVPDDWRAMHHTKRRALAKQISGIEPTNTAVADEVIEEYLTRP